MKRPEDKGDEERWEKRPGYFLVKILNITNHFK